MNKNISQNALYDQLKRDLENQKNIEKIYIPVALFKSPEEIATSSLSVKNKHFSILGAIIK